MKFNTKDLKDMNESELKDYKKNRHQYILNYMNVPVLSESSLKLRTRALIEEERDAGIKPGFWS
jgi:hypothetical protein